MLTPELQLRVPPQAHQTRRLTALALVAASAVALSALARTAGATEGTGAVVVFSGSGRGHGVGMSQDGAYWMAREGASSRQILQHFFPGTTAAQAEGLVRVVVREPAPGPVMLSLPGGGVVRSPRAGRQVPGFPISVRPGGRVSVAFDGSYRVDQGTSDMTTPPASTGTSTSTTTTTSTVAPEAPTTTTTTTPSTSTTIARPSIKLIADVRSGPSEAPRTSSSPIWVSATRSSTVGLPERGAAFRGSVEVVASGDGLRVLNELHVENYLRGLGEMPGSWPAAALEAQAVAARTYALRAMEASGEICADERCQVYLGAQAEDPASDAAARATAQQVLTFGGSLAATVYSADAGGTSATPSEGFGTPDDAYPYLRAAPYPTQTHHPWEVRIGQADLGRRLGYPGTLTGVRVADVGPSGRAVTVRLDGTAGVKDVAAGAVASAAGLQSSRWTLSLTSGAVPPPPTTVVAPVGPGAVRRELRAAESAAGALEHRPARAADTSTGSYVLLLALTGFATVTVLGRIRRGDDRAGTLDLS